MKRLIIVALVLFSTACFAADAKKEKPVEKFEVTITIVYNEVPSAEAIDIAKRAHEHFNGTCKHEVKIKKVPDNSATGFIYYNSGTQTISPIVTTWPAR